MGNHILGIIRDESNFKCLPCDRVNLDFERFREYRDSEEHPAQRPFEYPPLDVNKKLLSDIESDIPTILSYFLDGSRKTYKVADLIIDGRYMPLIAGQVGVCVMRRKNGGNDLEPFREFCCFENVIAFPDKANEDDLAYLEQRICEKTGTAFKLLRYAVKADADPVDLGIAKIMSEMQNWEINVVVQMAEKHLLSNTQVLVIDGPLRFRKKFDLVQFRNVIGLSKKFRPSFTLLTFT